MALVAGALAATIVDIRSRRIPNALTAAMAVAGVGLAAAGWSDVSLAASIGGLVVALALMLPGHALGATGAGDVKLMAAAGSLVGFPVAINAFLFTAIAGGVLAIGVATGRRRLAATIAGTGRLVAPPSDVRREIRSAAPARRFAYGPAIAIGSVAAALLG